ncbi:hypothetical protein V502_08517 [Pseudogymnoascus sp. VKM F-4520 (FW-2644)]|nr:hypothetical protein V502_08517 [Pseudogymnoascus sp. VKM F-4520 (FW-2644)]
MRLAPFIHHTHHPTVHITKPLFHPLQFVSLQSIHLDPVLPLIPASPHRSAWPVNKTRLRLSHSTILLPASRAARQQHQDSPKEEHHKRRKQSPDADLEARAAVSVIIDLLLDNSPGDEIRDQDNECNQPRDARDERGAQGTEDGGAERGEEREECETACHGVQDHDTGERISGVLGGGAVVAGAEGVEKGDGRVADAGVCAGVSAVAGGLLVIARGWDAVPEGTKVDGIAILEVDAEDGEVLDDWRRDGGDDEEDAGCEEQERAQMVEESEDHLCDPFSSPFFKNSLALLHSDRLDR